MSIGRRFPLRTGRLDIVRGDISRVEADAIVNAANSFLLGGGGVDGAIHRAAGPELLKACQEIKKTLPGGLLSTGEAVSTPAFKLGARIVIHTVGPVFYEHGEGAWPLLASCYRKALAIARRDQLDIIAFPSISTGAFGCPVERAAEVAVTTVRDDVVALGAPALVRFVLFDEQTCAAYTASAERLLLPGNKI
jgi:O-acetyl-ADP-ribose deacetylase (regulator of RNase III)